MCNEFATCQVVHSDACIWVCHAKFVKTSGAAFYTILKLKTNVVDQASL